MAAAAQPSPFDAPTKRLRAFAAQLNAVPAGALPKLQIVLSRVAQAVVGAPPGARAFSDDEEAQLVQVLGLDAAAPAPAPAGAGAAGEAPEAPLARLLLLLEGAAYVFETAAFHALKSAALGQALLALGVAEATAVAVVQVWAAESPAALARLRARAPNAPQQLLGSQWRISLPIGRAGLASAGADAAAKREAVATLELLLGPPDAAPQRSVALELPRAGLLSMLEALDGVQAQLDALS